MDNKKCIQSFILLIICSLVLTNSFYYKDISVFAISNEKITKSKEDDEKNKDNKEKPNKNIQYENTYWNLQDLYQDDKKWSKELKKFKKDINELKNYIGKVTSSKTHLAFSLDIKEKLDIRFEKLYGYVKLQQDINKNSYKYLDMKNEIDDIYNEYSKICSDLELEILKISDSKYQEILKDSKIKKKYGTYLNNITRNKKYYLDEKTEDLLCDVSKLTSLSRDVYELFRNMDKKNLLTSSEYMNIMENGSREDRKLAYQSELIPYNDNINTLSGLLIGQVQKNVFYSSQRGYESSLDMYLKQDDLDIKIYDKLIDTVNKNLDGLHKYTTLRKNILKLDKVQSYDLSIPIIDEVNQEITYDKAQGIIYSALSPLGKEYSDVIFKAFNEKWIDVYSNENKVSGAYCMSIYDSHPYMLLNYSNSIDGVSTLSHELGHAVYEYFSSKNQNYFNSNPSIFTHEVASTTNEALLYEYLIKNAKDNNEKAYYITKYLDMIKGTLYIQTMYAEFEKEIHEKVEKKESINALVLNDIWGNLLTKYYGKDYELDQLSKVGWARIPHFYNSFYVYKYATGCSAGVSFVQKIINGEGNNYINFLKKGSSDYPIKLLKGAGVNLEDTKAIKEALNKFEDLVDELEKLTLS